MRQSYKVAVVGGGFAGLVTARELKREGLLVTVFEKADHVGGIWLYNSRVDTDLLGLDPNREIVHSSLYRSLRVNLPRQIMGFMDYPFMKKEGGDPRTFPGHEEVLKFLEDFARDFRLMELIRFGHDVVRVELPDEARHRWVVESRTRETELRWESKEEVFEAVVICNGKHTEPKIAEFPGRDAWPGLQMHSHSYWTPEQFENEAVPCIVMELQAKWVAKVLSGTVKLPTQAEMADSVEELYGLMEKGGRPKNLTYTVQQDKAFHFLNPNLSFTVPLLILFCCLLAVRI